MSSNFLEALAGTQLYPLTDRRLSKLSHAEQIACLSRLGVRLIQFRDKTLSPRDFYREADEALRVAREVGVKLIINDRVDIALSLGADGVHLGQEDLPPEAARQLLGSEAIIGLSTHNLEQARLAATQPVDYIALGPIFSTVSKDKPDPEVGLGVLRQAREVVGQTPLVAIGGISSANSREVIDSGADAIALISDLWSASNPAVAYAEWLPPRFDRQFL